MYSFEWLTYCSHFIHYIFFVSNYFADLGSVTICNLEPYSPRYREKIPREQVHQKRGDRGITQLVTVTSCRLTFAILEIQVFFRNTKKCDYRKTGQVQSFVLRI